MKFKEETIANIFMKQWHHNYSFDLIKNPAENLIENIKVLERENMFKHEFITFMDNRTLTPLYVTLPRVLNPYWVIPNNNS